MWMSVTLGRITMSGPAGVTNADMIRRAMFFNLFFETFDFADSTK